MTEKLVESFDIERPSALGLAALILIAQREQTSVTYQYKEWNFSDIPREIIEELDELGDEEQFAIAQQIIDSLIDVMPGDAQADIRLFTEIMPIKISG